MSSTNSGIEPNELAELYDSFNVIDTLLDQVIESEAFDDQAPVHPIFSWKEAIRERVSGDGWENAPCYGEQQYHRNSISINEYREEYGDGTRITKFEAINTVRLPSDQQDRLRKLIDIGKDEPPKTPIAPSSGEPIPLVVENETELEHALDLLSEFPEFPDVNADVGGQDAKKRLLTVSEIDEGQRVKELVVKVISIDDTARPKREVDLQVEDVSGESHPFTIWSKHPVTTTWTAGTWYWLHESRVQVWDNSKGAKRNLSSTADLVVEQIGDSLEWDKIHTYRQVYGVDFDGSSSVSESSESESASGKVRGGSGSDTSKYAGKGKQRSEDNKVDKLLEDLDLE